ncbi:MAG: carboxylating nicotinate-nucleotide diphosphorylase, partial [Candidatus Eisenbacteria bacterium]|nr:carboxylating nicotinate-nucleotide diphosphorylase [Candidatus Latescibacterota bacterium]MBD3302524.1 carboxylating nicotinate-nucleotide diphosphorylase [Candidatus Eisenbacteria bacterium]
MGESEDLRVVEEALARLALLEDVGTGDPTAEIVPSDRRARGVVRAKQEGIASGLGAAIEVFRIVDESVAVTVEKRAGERFAPGDRLLVAEGATRSLLTAERTALNFLQHLSGIATLTARFVAAAAGSVRITDTRKTCPGLRLLEKEAVRHGGGVNHRLGLYDAVMIKENHVEAVGGIAAAVEAARAASSRLPIVVEVRDREEARAAARLAVGRILLDNMSPEEAGACAREIAAIAATLPDPDPEEAGHRWIEGTWRPGDSLIQVEVSGRIRLEEVP